MPLPSHLPRRAGKGRGQGPAGGPGNGAPPHILDTSPEKQKARALKAAAARRKRIDENNVGTRPGDNGA